MLHEPENCIPPTNLTLSLADKDAHPTVGINKDLAALVIFSDDYSIAGKNITL